jgi:hypothetical protein
MATFYLDFEGGNDSNDGTTFANRWKTITSGATAARTAPGDVIRIMKSPDPVSLGVNGTFTKQSATVTLASAVTANIDRGEVLWTTATNVTSITSTTRKEGNLAVQLSIGAAFTTGLVGYRATGTLDLSAYNNISFWIRTSIATVANTFRIDLCSDTAGATPVHSFTIDTAFGAAIWKPVTFKNGAALSSSIQSVAITALLDPGTNVVLIDNIIACNDLHFNSLIGTSSSATNMIWYPIRSINGTTVQLESEQANVSSTAVRGWHDTTTTTTAYVRDTVRLTSAQTINESGSAAALIKYSGGWDRTNMSTQDGVTFVQADRNIFTGATFTHATQFTEFSRAGVLWGAGSFAMAGSYNRLYDCGTYGANTSSNPQIDNYIENFYGISNNTTPLSITGCVVQTAYLYSNFGNGVLTSGFCEIKDITSNNNSTHGMQLGGCTFGKNIICRDNVQFGISSTSYAEINGITTSGNLSGAINNSSLLRINNASLSEATKINSGSIRTPANASRYSTYVGYQRANSNDTVLDINTPVHGTATRSYRHLPTSNTFSQIPIVQSLQPFAVNGGALVTFKIWVQRSNTGVMGRVRLNGYVTPGVDADVTASTSAAVNTWEELTVTCTPSAAGVVQIDLESYYVSATGFVYFGDATVTQA